MKDLGAWRLRDSQSTLHLKKGNYARTIHVIVADALRVVEDSRATRSLFEDLKDPDEDMRKAVTMAMSPVAYERATEVFNELLSDGDDNVKLWAVC